MNKLKTFFTFNWHDLNLSQIKSYDFWFGYDRSVIHATDRFILILGVVLVLFGVIALVYSFKANNEFMAKVAKWKAKILIIIGLLEMFWFVLRYQNIQAFGTRFTAGLILLVGVLWIAFGPAKYFITRYKTDLAEAERKASREKYLNRK